MGYPFLTHVEPLAGTLVKARNKTRPGQEMTRR